MKKRPEGRFVLGQGASLKQPVHDFANGPDDDSPEHHDADGL